MRATLSFFTARVHLCILSERVLNLITPKSNKAFNVSIFPLDAWPFGIEAIKMFYTFLMRAVQIAQLTNQFSIYSPFSFLHPTLLLNAFCSFKFVQLKRNTKIIIIRHENSAFWFIMHSTIFIKRMAEKSNIEKRELCSRSKKWRMHIVCEPGWKWMCACDFIFVFWFFHRTGQGLSLYLLSTPFLPEPFLDAHVAYGVRRMHLWRCQRTRSKKSSTLLCLETRSLSNKNLLARIINPKTTNRNKARE